MSRSKTRLQGEASREMVKQMIETYGMESLAQTFAPAE